MKKLSSRALSAVTNVVLAVIVLALGAVCFLPSASPAAGVERTVRKGNSDGVSLMFNVYWGTEEVYSVLDVLDEYGVKATFFLGGCWADDNVPCVKEIAARGHEIGTHGYFHRDHDKLSFSENVEEIKTSADYLARAAGVEVRLFAPPSGAYSDETLDAAESLGMRTILWSKDTVDWRDKDETLCFRRATEGVGGGDLVLMHPMPHTVAALPKILENYRGRGLRVVTVGENIA